MQHALRIRTTIFPLLFATAVAACGGDSTGPDDDGDGGGAGTLLTSGTPRTGLAGAEDSETIYRISVPAGATNLLVTTAGGTGDLDLYVRAGQVPTPSASDCESAGGSNDESCSFDDPATGTWYILLSGFDAYSGVTLTATVTGGSGDGDGDGDGDGAGTAVTWASVSMGASHACGLSIAGKAYCWGDRVSGETGDGDPVEGSGIRFNNRVPYEVAGGHTFSMVSAGGGHSCGITTAGALYCWGSNSRGQIGDGGSTGGSSGPHWRNVPVAIAPGMSFSSVEAGGAVTCAVASGGTTYCWGDNDSYVASGGEFGAPNPIMTPASIGITLAEVSSASASAACGRTADGDVYCWGSDSWGIIGDGPTNTAAGAGPQQALGGPYQQVSVGTSSACALGTDDEIYCWGANHEGQLGYAASGDYHNDLATSPTALGLPQTWKQVSVGGGFACGLTTAGTAMCWGLNASGQAGIGSFTPRNPLPTAVTGGHVFASLSPNSNGSSMCGVTTSGDAYCWGTNTSWQLGATGSSIYLHTPIEVEPAN